MKKISLKRIDLFALSQFLRKEILYGGEIITNETILKLGNVKLKLEIQEI